MSDKPGANTFQTLNGHFKETYAANIQNLVPDGVKLLKSIQFIKAEKQPGNLYHQPVILGSEHGFTYGGSLGNAFELEAAVQSSNADAQVRGSELVLRSILSIAAASRSANSKAAFISETKLLVENMLKSFAKRLEIELLYGQNNIGVVESVSTTTIKIEDHEWAAGIWSGGENMPISVFSADGSTLRGNASLVSVSLDDKEVVTSVDLSGSIIATDIIHFNSAVVAGPTYNEFAGLHKIITNTGTIFNINASSYSLWQGNTVEVGTNFSGSEAELSFEKIEEAIARSMEKGLSDEEVMVLCSPLSWKNLLTEQAAKREYDGSYSSERFEQGAKNIRFHGPNGMIEIVSSIYCKEGYAYVCPLKECMRVGSSDITFEQPGFEGKFLRLLENHNGYEMRCYSDQALFTSKPGLFTLLTFIKS